MTGVTPGDDAEHFYGGRPVCSVSGMTESLTNKPRVSANGTLAQAAEPVEGMEPPSHASSDVGSADESPPGTPRWVKGLAVVLVVLMLAFAGLHLTGNAPTHMGSPSGEQHGIQLP